MSRPVLGLAAGHVTRTNSQVSARLHCTNQGRKLLRLVRAVSVHFNQNVVACLKAPIEAGEVCATQTVLNGAVQNVNLGILSRQLISNLAGAVGAVIIHHENVHLGSCLAKTLYHDGQVLLLVIRRDDS